MFVAVFVYIVLDNVRLQSALRLIQVVRQSTLHSPHIVELSGSIIRTSSLNVALNDYISASRQPGILPVTVESSGLTSVGIEVLL